MKIDIEKKFAAYIDLAYKEKPNKDSMQYIQLRQVFYCGVYMLLRALKDDIPEVSDDEGMHALQDVESQCMAFMTSELLRKHNGSGH